MLKPKIIHAELYGSRPTTESVRQIFFENLGPLVIASTLSIGGGIGLQLVEKHLFFLLPVLIVLPALADMIGDFASTIAARSVAMIEQGIVPAQWQHSKTVIHFASVIFVLSLLFSISIGSISLVLALFQGFALTWLFVAKFMTILVILNIVMVLIQISFSLRIGFLVAFNGHDPDNVLIPLATSLSDIAVLGLFSLLVFLFF